MIGIPDYPIVQKLIGTLLLGLMLWCATLAAPAADLPSFCERLPRPAQRLIALLRLSPRAPVPGR